MHPPDTLRAAGATSIEEIPLRSADRPAARAATVPLATRVAGYA